MPTFAFAFGDKCSATSELRHFFSDCIKNFDKLEQKTREVDSVTRSAQFRRAYGILQTKLIDSFCIVPFRGRLHEERRDSDYLNYIITVKSLILAQDER